MKGHFHLAQISSTQIYKFEPCGNDPCNCSKKASIFLFIVCLPRKLKYVTFINIKKSPHKVSKYPKYLLVNP